LSCISPATQGIEVRQEVVEFLAHRISTNVRVLEGALTRLFAFASLVGREITVELTQDCLSDILRASDRKVTVEEIQRKVSDHYNIRLSDMLGPKRLRSFARPAPDCYVSVQAIDQPLIAGNWPQIWRSRPYDSDAWRAEN
jgi:chromosomal replication initiation ATPase DnaA